MNIGSLFYGDQEIILIGKAILITIIGILIGFITKFVLRKKIDKLILKKIFKSDISTYETSKIINKILTETLQWIIIVVLFNYSLRLLGFDFLNNFFSYIVSDIQKISIFIIILVVGILVSKFISSKIKEKNVDYKDELSAVLEIIIMSAFVLTALEFIGIRATALTELYKVILYIIGIIVILIIVKPSLFKKKKNKK